MHVTISEGLLPVQVYSLALQHLGPALLSVQQHHGITHINVSCLQGLEASHSQVTMVTHITTSSRAQGLFS